MKMFRKMRDEEGEDVLKSVGLCWIQGSEIPDVPEEYHEQWFTLGIDPYSEAKDILVHYPDSIPIDVVSTVLLFVNNAPNKMTLSTHYLYHMILNGDRVPHQDLVYIAETEQEVWDYLNSL